MRTTLAVLITVSISLIFTNIGSAIDLGTATGIWLFDEVVDDIAKDSSENANDGTILGGTELVEGKFGSKGLELDGVDGHVKTSFQAIPTEEGTIVVWVNSSREEDNQYVVYTSEGGGNGFGGQTEFHLGFIGTTYAFFYTTVMASVEITGSSFKPNNWSHIAVTWKTDDKAQLYADGELLAEQATVEPDSAVWIDYTYFGRPSADTRFYEGVIDEIGIFNVVLEKADIQKIMNEGLGEAVGVFAVSPAKKLATTWGQIKYE